MRINKFLSHFSKLSRRQADKALEQGRVKINNKQAELGQKVSEDDKVSVDNQDIASSSYSYVIFHKPIGYVTSRGKQSDEKIIYDILPEKYHSLKPVGRLDKNTSGLLLLTNDGDYAEELMHPRNGKQKVYRLELSKIVDASNMALIQEPGVELDDGISQMSVRSLSDTKPRYEIIITEGRNRQIRRTFEALGYEVTKLHRTKFGSYKLGSLKLGETAEVQKLAHG